MHIYIDDFIIIRNTNSTVVLSYNLSSATKKEATSRSC